MPQKLYNNKYRVGSARRKDWDYSGSGAYFITICTQGRKPYFGSISDRIMQFSELGRLVQSEWCRTSEIRKEMNLELGQWVVMPDHFHAILFIGSNPFNQITQISIPMFPTKAD